MSDKGPCPKGKLARGAVVGWTATNIGVRRAAHLGKRPFVAPECRNEADRQNEAEIGRVLMAALTKLRGCGLKVAQIAAQEIEMLPEAIREELAAACYRVPPMNRALTRAVLTRELGRPEAVFRRFDWTPFAAASLGQVHAAEDSAGTELAVKIQYPGASEGMTSDVALLKAALRVTPWHRVFEACLPLVERKLQEELDYAREADAAAFFYETLPKDRYAVPFVEPALSSRRVLSTRRLSGLHLADWSATRPSRASRDHYGQRLVDLFNECVFGLNRIHADPNPGNFLFRDDGRLGVLDFGCTVALAPSFVEATRQILLEQADANAVRETLYHTAVGVHYKPTPDKGEFAAFLMEWGRWLREPYAADVYDFEENADYFERGHRFVKSFYRYIDHYDSEFIYYGRTLHGLFRMLQRLGARVRLRPTG